MLMLMDTPSRILTKIRFPIVAIFSFCAAVLWQFHESHQDPVVVPSGSPAPLRASHQEDYAAACKKVDAKFPAMDDNTTCLESCSPEVLSRLYHAWCMDAPFPYSFFLLYEHSNDTKPAFIESTEPFYYHDYDIIRRRLDDCETFPDFMHRSDPKDDEKLRGFDIYTDGFPEVFVMTWEHTSCAEWINGTEIIKATVPLVEGQFTGEVTEGGNIYIPDGNESCWLLMCDDYERTNECVDKVQEGLRLVTLDAYVLALYDVECE